MSAQSPILKLWVGDAFIRNAGMLQSWAKRTVVVTPLTLEWYFDTALTKIAGSVPLKGATLIPAKKVLANLSGYHLVCVDLDWSGRDFFPLRFVMTEAHDAILVRIDEHNCLLEAGSSVREHRTNCFTPSPLPPPPNFLAPSLISGVHIVGRVRL